MFWKKDKEEKIRSTVLDAQEKKLIDILDILPPDSEEYARIAENLEKIYKARETGYGHEKDNGITLFDVVTKIALPIMTVVIPIAAQNKQVKWMLGFEEERAFTTKATQFMTKPKR